MLNGPNVFLKISLFGWLWGIVMSIFYLFGVIVPPPGWVLIFIFGMGAYITWKLIQAREWIQEFLQTKTFD